MGEGGKGGTRGKPPGAQRLKAALRENLRRRKAQARGRAAARGREAEEPPEASVRQPGNDTDK
jgi:hypothetical protein